MELNDTDCWALVRRLAAEGLDLEWGTDVYVAAPATDDAPAQAWDLLFRPARRSPFVVEAIPFDDLTDVLVPQDVLIWIGRPDAGAGADEESSDDGPTDERPVDPLDRRDDLKRIDVEHDGGQWFPPFLPDPLDTGELDLGARPALALVSRKTVPIPDKLPARVDLDLRLGSLVQVATLDRIGEPESRRRFRASAGGTLNRATVEFDIRPRRGAADEIIARAVDGDLVDSARPLGASPRRVVPEGGGLTLFLVFDCTTPDPQHWDAAAGLLSRGAWPDDPVGGPIIADPDARLRSWNHGLRLAVGRGITRAVGELGLDQGLGELRVVSFCDEPSSNLNPLGGVVPPRDGHVAHSQGRRLAAVRDDVLDQSCGYHPGVDLCDDLDGALGVVVEELDELDEPEGAIVLIVGDSPPHFDEPPSHPLWGLSVARGARGSVGRRPGRWREVRAALGGRGIPLGWVWPDALSSSYRRTPAGQRVSHLHRTAQRALRPGFRYFQAPLAADVEAAVVAAIDELVHEPVPRFARAAWASG